MGKEKKEKKSVDESQNEGEAEEMSYEDRLKYVSVISKPMAPKKLTKKVSNFSYFLEANKSKAGISFGDQSFIQNNSDI